MSRISTIFCCLFLTAVLVVSVHGRPDHHHPKGGSENHAHDEHDEIFNRLTNLERNTANMTTNVTKNTNALKDVRNTLKLLLPLLVPDAEKMQKLFFQAAREGNVLLVELALETGTDIAAKDEQKYSALHLAAKNGRTAVVEALVKAIAATEAKGGEEEQTPWDLAVLAKQREAAKALLAHKTYSEGELSLLNAAKNGSAARVPALKKAGVNLDVRFPEHNYATPLILAAANGHKGIVEALLKAKVNINARDLEGMTALHFAAHEGHREIVEELLKNNAHARAKSAYGLAPEQVASKDGIRALLQTKPDKKTATP